MSDTENFDTLHNHSTNLTAIVISKIFKKKFLKWHFITTVFTTSWKSLSAKTVSQCNVVAATCFDMLTFLGFLSTMTMISKKKIQNIFPFIISNQNVTLRHLSFTSKVVLPQNLFLSKALWAQINGF